VKLVCLDMEGVLTPEIWIALARETGIPELQRTTRDEPDYDSLMRGRIGILERHNLRLPDIQRVIGAMSPLDGAPEFLAAVQAEAPLVILSDTFTQFAEPLRHALGDPVLLCNELQVELDGRISGYRMRKPNGKEHAVRSFQQMGLQVFAAGDSHNDVAMIRAADAGAFFQAPDQFREEFPDLASTTDYNSLFVAIRRFLTL
jgi:phosphoserine/homoserine phosphotransferase